jgi:hypothetical protein
LVEHTPEKCGVVSSILTLGIFYLQQFRLTLSVGCPIEIFLPPAKNKLSRKLNQSISIDFPVVWTTTRTPLDSFPHTDGKSRWSETIAPANEAKPRSGKATRAQVKIATPSNNETFQQHKEVMVND